MGWLRDKLLEIIQTEERSLRLKNKIKVKKLEWLTVKDNVFKASTLKGYYLIGFVNLLPDNKISLDRFDSSAGVWLPSKYFSSLEEAMAEAQREFDQEILSYIEIEDD